MHPFFFLHIIHSAINALALILFSFNILLNFVVFEGGYIPFSGVVYLGQNALILSSLLADP